MLLIKLLPLVVVQVCVYSVGVGGGCAGVFVVCVVV